MNFFSNWKENQKAKQQLGIKEEAIARITLTDFDNKIFISIGGIPLIEMDKEWKTEEIISKLTTLRTNYVNSQVKENNGQLVEHLD